MSAERTTMAATRRPATPLSFGHGPQHERNLGAAARHIASQAQRRMPVLWWGGWLALVVSIPLALLSAWDDRTLLGVSVWVKPWKFHVSLGVHMLTLAWFAALLRDTPERARGLAIMSGVVLCSAVFELVYITWRAAMGEASHYNVSTPFAGAMYTLMGIGAVSLTASAGWLGWVVLRARDFEWGPVLQRGVGLGLLLGFVLGTLSGAYVSAQTGHHVGGTLSDAQGLPIVGWSRDGGDLRVAHFFGLHAMQVLPLVAWILARRMQPDRARLGLSMFIAAYAATTVLCFVQAVMGRPFV